MVPGTLLSHPGHAPAPNHHLSTAPDLITEGRVRRAWQHFPMSHEGSSPSLSRFPTNPRTTSHMMSTHEAPVATLRMYENTQLEFV